MDASSKPLTVTVITVCFNSAATIRDALRSVATQRWPHVQHIVVDGGSADGTPSLIREERGDAVLLVSEPDRGIYDAMNKGLRLATGDLIGFLNADDMFASPDSLEQLAQAATGADAIYGDLLYVRHDRPESVVRNWKSGPFDPASLQRGWMPPHPTFYLRREWVAKIGEFDIGLRIAADYDFMLRALRCPGIRVRYLPEVLVLMRTGGASNRSLKALVRKSLEDLRVMRRNRVGGVWTLACKNLRKVPQFFSNRRLS